ncbi:glycosyltransferase [Alteromonas sp. 1_MG-2023]|uniref:glycosyltransferase n=1 Tax=Alteromonas sp. 1_MG-2023 TaxID=3062669 RepID=UPI0026E30458|nr:glycosyltransferase [Alteromonas sp. 1_MG-2023]MDO6567507.1 glycosyltransferase [Alteromonas sp. 1_MG-2023]
MKRILFVINSMGYGGAERALVNLLSKPSFYSDFDVHVALLDDEPIIRALPENITLHQLDSRRSLASSLLSLRRLQREFNPDLCVSFLVRANVVNAALKLTSKNRKAILCERMHLSSHLNGQFKSAKRLLAGILPSITYRYADAVIGVSTGVTEDLVENFNVPSIKATTIFNPYNIALIEQLSEKAPEFILPTSFVISTGRLTPSKNVKGLIDAYLSSNESAPLCILGEGEQKKEIENYIKFKNAKEKVLLLGYAENPFAIVSKAKYYVSASLNEGFPNALLEAMALGLPVIMTNCPSGPAEILNEDPQYVSGSLTEAKHGLLVPLNNTSELTRAFNVYNKESIRADYAKRARKRAEDFSIESIANQYWQFLRQTLLNH